MSKQSNMFMLLVGFESIFRISTGLHAEQLDNPSDADLTFVVYTKKESLLNHFVPAGLMGDYRAVEINDGWTNGVDKPDAAKDGGNETAAEQVDETCLRIIYSCEPFDVRTIGHQFRAGWAGIYWQHPANNWGDKRGGHNLNGYKKLTF